VAREAVSRCPVCTRFFCRECVTEFDGRVLCSSCIEAQVAARSRPRERSLWKARAKSCAALLSAFLVSWAFFYFSGRIASGLSGLGN
jgi:hypothetical protein